jgi:hypothetical protein
VGNGGTGGGRGLGRRGPAAAVLGYLDRLAARAGAHTGPLPGVPEPWCARSSSPDHHRPAIIAAAAVWSARRAEPAAGLTPPRRERAAKRDGTIYSDGRS